MTTTSDVDAVDLASVDLTDLSYWVDGAPYALFARMRRQAGLHWNALGGSESGFWSLTRFADIAAVSRDTATFSSERGGVFTTSDGGAVPLDALRQILLGMDDPRHGKQRKVIHAVFTPRLVARHAVDIRNTVTELLDEVIEKGSCDFVEDIAVELPLRVIADLLGVPKADRAKLFEWTNTASLAQATNDQTMGLGALAEMGGYLSTLTADRKADPTDDDLISLLLTAEVDGESLTTDEVTFLFATLMFAGNDTTRNTASGAMRALIQHESERRKLIADPRTMPNAVEEMLRWVCAVVYFARVAQRDTHIGGHPIREGQRVVMWYAAGSRDPSANPQPETFNVTRDKPQHQAFGGGGAHFCIGAALARLELRILFEELTRRVPDIQICGPVTRLQTNFLNALTSMPITFTPGRREATT